MFEGFFGKKKEAEAEGLSKSVEEMKAHAEAAGGQPASFAIDDEMPPAPIAVEGYGEPTQERHLADNAGETITGEDIGLEMESITFESDGTVSNADISERPTGPADAALKMETVDGPELAGQRIEPRPKHSEEVVGDDVGIEEQEAA
ncbi:hypothetical protein KC906_02595 [Candidatus Kaiserbacteria bacterium]|nr:hypothetical protein [Candidatus Kaiserbacteria bacterium]MCB9812509.1 hypothetical protein [Candidatus Nomurabacteria bacterium]